MTNPAPRPALRKAEDSTVHPAAPARSPRAVQPRRRQEPTAAQAPRATKAPRPSRAEAEVAAPPTGGTSGRAGTTKKAATKAATKQGGGRTDRAFSGATSDHLRPAAAAVDADQTARRRRKAYTDVDLMRGKTVALDVSVPKRLRKAARTEAKRRGLDLDAVTTELLHRWLTGR